MTFDPDAYLAAKPAPKFDPDAYLASKPAPDYTVGRWAGLEARNLAQGVAAIPATLMDVPAGAYNIAADAVKGHGHGFRFNEMNQNVAGILDKIGLPRPATPGEQVGSTIAQSVVGAGSGAGLGHLMQNSGGPVAAAVGQSMTASPGKAMASAITGGGSVAAAQQAGLPWYAQAAAGAAGGALPYLNLASGGALSPQEQAAMSAGYRLPPATMEHPSMLSRLLGGWSGKIKTQQAASAANQETTNGIAAKELGLPDDTSLDDNVFAGVRAKAGKAYTAVKAALPSVQTDEQFKADAAALGRQNSELARDFPELAKNEAVADLSASFANKKQFSTAAGIEAVKTLRADGTKNLQAIGDPQRNALGFAQRRAADAIDDLIERNLDRMGQADGMQGDVGFLSEEYRAARRLIAKSHDVEAATNPATGDVSAAKMAQLGNRRPLTGGLATISDTANAFPKATQMPSKFGGVEPLSVLDILTAASPVAAGAMSGKLAEGAAVGATALSRPLARALIMSGAYQHAMQRPGQLLGPQFGAQGAPLNAALISALQQKPAQQ